MGQRSFTEHWQSEGGGRELLKLALPLILSTSFWTLQIVIDSVMLSWLSSDAVAANFSASLLFWTPFALLYFTAAYVSTFVAQYVGAGRSHRVGPAVWQGLHFSLMAGVGFLALVPLADWLVAQTKPPEAIRPLEAAYFRCLCFTALPTLIGAAVGAFFAGRGETKTVMLLNAVGLVVNALLDYAWIFGNWGFPAWGIEGAGWATVTAMWASAVLGLALMFRPRFRVEYATLSGWRFEGDLFRRLMRYGLPAGFQGMLEGVAFTAFTILVGWLGQVELNATSIAFRINMVAFLPMLGMAQAVAVLVGQRLGQDRPDLAERSTWTGLGLTWLYMTAVALLYVLAPGVFLGFFANDNDPDAWLRVSASATILLRFVAVYSVVDSANLILSFALRGAGDTRFVTVVALVLSWLLMVVPAWASWYFEWGLYWAWAFTTFYIVVQALVFLVRFRGGKWKSMRVIEAAPIEAETGLQGPHRSAERNGVAQAEEAVQYQR